MNLSNPEPIKSNEKKVSLFGKIWAGINLVALLGDFIMPKTVKDNTPILWRNIGIIFFILIFGYFLGCGILINVKWIIHATSTISFSVGDWFYYFGFVIMTFVLVDIFNLNNKVQEFCLQKKIFSSSVNVKSTKDINKIFSNNVSEVFKKNKIYNAISSIMGALTFLWMICGIFFYDQTLFILFFGFSFIYPFAMIPLKNISDIKKSFIAETAINIIMLSIILIHHFYF